MKAYFSLHDLCARVNFSSKRRGYKPEYERIIIHESQHLSQVLNTSVGLELFVACECLHRLIYDRLLILGFAQESIRMTCGEFKIFIDGKGPRPISIPLRDNLKDLYCSTNLKHVLGDSYESILRGKIKEFDETDDILARNAQDILDIESWIEGYLGRQSISAYDEFERVLKDNIPVKHSKSLGVEFLKYITDSDTPQVIFLSNDTPGFELRFGSGGSGKPPMVHIPITVRMLLETQALCGEIMESLPTLRLKENNDRIYVINPDVVLPYKNFPLLGEGLSYSLPILWAMQAHKEEYPELHAKLRVDNLGIFFLMGFLGNLHLMLNIALCDEFDPPTLKPRNYFDSRLSIHVLNKFTSESTKKHSRCVERFMLLLRNMESCALSYFRTKSKPETKIQVLRSMVTNLKFSNKRETELVSLNMINTDSWIRTLDSYDNSGMKYDTQILDDIVTWAKEFRRVWNAFKASSDGTRYTTDVLKVLELIRCRIVVAFSDGCMDVLGNDDNEDTGDMLKSNTSQYYHAMLVRYLLLKAFKHGDLHCYDRSVCNGRMIACDDTVRCYSQSSHDCKHKYLKRIISVTLDDLYTDFEYELSKPKNDSKDILGYYL
jgi:hypothetical protein